MISFPANADICVVHTPVSFGCGIDGMCRYCKLILQREPMDRAYFMFVNKLKTQARILWYDGQGFLLCNKRLSTGTFNNWPKPNEGISSIIPFFDAQTVFASGKIGGGNCKKLWKKIA